MGGATCGDGESTSPGRGRGSLAQDGSDGAEIGAVESDGGEAPVRGIKGKRPDVPVGTPLMCPVMGSMATGQELVRNEKKPSRAFPTGTGKDRLTECEIESGPDDTGLCGNTNDLFRDCTSRGAGRVLRLLLL